MVGQPFDIVKVVSCHKSIALLSLSDSEMLVVTRECKPPPKGRIKACFTVLAEFSKTRVLWHSTRCAVFHQKAEIRCVTLRCGLLAGDFDTTFGYWCLCVHSVRRDGILKTLLWPTKPRKWGGRSEWPDFEWPTTLRFRSVCGIGQWCRIRSSGTHSYTYVVTTVSITSN